MKLYFCDKCETYNLIGPPAKGLTWTHELTYPDHPAKGTACLACETLLEYSRVITGTLRQYMDPGDSTDY